jgi:hypothetical protein
VIVDDGFEYTRVDSIAQRNALLSRVINMTKDKIFKPKKSEDFLASSFEMIGKHRRDTFPFTCKRVEIS